MIKDKIKKLISRDRIEEAIEIISKARKDANIEKEIILVSARYFEIKKYSRMGNLSLSDELLQKSRIRLAILEICEKIYIENHDVKNRRTEELIKILEDKAQKIEELLSSPKRYDQTTLIKIERVRSLFLSLHHRNIEALKNSHLILSHELSREIQFILWGAVNSELIDVDFSITEVLYRREEPKPFGRINLRRIIEEQKRDAVISLFTYHHKMPFNEDTIPDNVFNINEQIQKDPQRFNRVLRIISQ